MCGILCGQGRVEMEMLLRTAQRKYGLLSFFIFLVAPGPALGEGENPLASFRRAISIHRGLICGHPPVPALIVRYSVEPIGDLSLGEARARMLEVFRHRSAKWGVHGPAIFPLGENIIEIQYNGSQPGAAAMRVTLERPGVLGFHAVEMRSSWFEALGPAVKEWNKERASSTLTLERDHDGLVIRAESLEELNDFTATLPELPSNRILRVQEETWNSGHEPNTRWRLYLLHEKAPVSNVHLASADVSTDSYNGLPHVSLEFTKAGSLAFADLTEDLTGQLLAIVLDGRVISAPKVMERIEGGRAQISLGRGGAYQDNFEEAHGLAMVLRSGSHPAELRIISEDIEVSSLGEGWRALGPLPFTAQALAILLTFRYGCY
jgi:preprotein translocase subunit SecD